MAKSKYAGLFLLAVMLCTLCSCATRASHSGIPDLYDLTVTFLSPKGDSLHRIEIDVRPGVPFAVRTLDAAGNHYEVNGTMHQKPHDTFGFEPGNAAMQLVQGGSLGGGLPDLELGKAIGLGFVAGVVWYGENIRLTKK